MMSGALAEIDAVRVQKCVTAGQKVTVGPTPANCRSPRYHVSGVRELYVDRIMTTDTGIDRRAFTLSLAASLAAASAVSDEAVADEEKKSDEKKKPKPEPVARKEPPEAAYILELITRRYPDNRLDEQALKSIVGDIRADMFRSRVLSQFPLENGDEPGFTFGAWRSDLSELSKQRAG